MKRYFATLMLFFILASPVAAQDSLNVAKIGSLYDFWGLCEDIEYNGGYVYVPDMTLGMRVIDVADPATPEEVAVWDLEAPFRIIVEGNIAYYLDFLGPYLKTLNVMNPVNPVPLDSIEITSSSTDLELDVSGSLAVLTDPAFGLTLYDVSDPSNLTVFSTYTDHVPEYSIINGDYVYVSVHNTEEMVVLDISTPSAPQFLGTVPAPEEIDDMEIRGSMLYCACDWDGFAVFSLVDPAYPTLIGTFQTPGDCETLAAQDNYLYLCANDIGLVVYNVANPFNPIEVATCPAGGNIRFYEIKVEGGTAYASGSNPKVTIFDISVPSSPSIESTIGEGAFLLAIDVHGDYAYFADQLGSFYVADVSDPTNPQHAAELGPLGKPFDVAVNGTYAYLATEDDGVLQINITNPSDPWVVYQLDLEGDGRQLYEQSNIVYIAESLEEQDAGRLTIVDFIEFPPQIISETLLQAATGIHVDGMTAYVCSDYPNNLAIIDISDPSNPVVLSDVAMPGSFHSLVSYGNHLYVANGGYFNFLIFDVSNPASPSLVNTIELEGYVSSVSIAGDQLIVGTFGDGFLIYDLIDPANPTIYGYYPGNSLDVVVEGDYAYSAELRTMSVFQIGPVEPDPVVVTMTPTSETNLPASGGTLFFDANVVSNLPDTYPDVMFWTKVKLPNGNFYPPIQFQMTFTLLPFMNVSGSLTQDIPAFAPEGNYEMWGWVGASPYGGPSFGNSFPFTKSAVVMGGASVNDWASDGHMIADDAAVSEVLPSSYEMLPVYPNPFNPTTMVSVSLPQAADLTVTVYNITGQQVVELANSQFSAGNHMLTFDASNLASGLYFIQAHVPGHLNTTQKVMLVR
ncbi:LVIVD repeat protein [bacterium BMS3Bbin04]|nr:LVIVD repeat protein [bacterium BMS3Bbin04]